MDQIPNSVGGLLLFTEYKQPHLVPRSYNDPPTNEPIPGFIKVPVTDMQVTLASTYLIATPIVHLIALFVFVARAYTRAFPTWRFGIDDYIISLAFALMTVMFSLQCSTLRWAFGGRHPDTLTIDELQQNSMVGSIALPFWAWSTGLTKISIAVMLLKFQDQRGWRLLMYFMILLNVFIIAFLGVANLFQCIPYAAVWDIKNEIQEKKCWEPRMFTANLYVACICNVTSDVVFSLMPLTFLGKVRRPLREKVVIGGLMAVGLLASGFSLARLVITIQKSQSTDFGAAIILTAILTCLEVQISLIAACVPTLRSSTRRFLSRIGLLSETTFSNEPMYGSGSSGYSGGDGIVTREPSTRKRVRELHEAEIGLGRRIRRRSDAIMQESWLDDDNDDEDEEDAIYSMDPVTGRITCTPLSRPDSHPHSHSDDRTSGATSTSPKRPPTSDDHDHRRDTHHLGEEDWSSDEKHIGIAR